MQHYRQNAGDPLVARRLRAIKETEYRVRRLRALDAAVKEAEYLDRSNGKRLMGRLAQALEQNRIYYDGGHDPYRYELYFNLILSAFNMFDSEIIKFLAFSGIDTKKLSAALNGYQSVRSRLDQKYFANRSKRNITASEAQALYRLIEEWELARCTATVALNRGPQRVGCCPGLEARILKEIGFTEASKKHPYRMSAAVSSQISGFKKCKAASAASGGGSSGGGSAYAPLPEPSPPESSVSPVLIFGGLAVAALAVVVVMNKKKKSPPPVA